MISVIPQEGRDKLLCASYRPVRHKMEALILSFDAVRWSFLYLVLSKFVYHPSIINTFAALYNKPTARIKINGDLTN